MNLSINARGQLNRVPFTVIDEISVTQGAGEDAETWTMYSIRFDDGKEQILENYKGRLFLWTFMGELPPNPAEAYWEESGKRTYKSKNNPFFRGKLDFLEGVLADFDTLVVSNYYFHGDGIIEYGGEGKAFYYANTPAEQVEPYPLPHKSVSSAVKVIDYILALTLPGLAIFDLISGQYYLTSFILLYGLFGLFMSFANPTRLFYRAGTLFLFVFATYFIGNIVREFVVERFTPDLGFYPDSYRTLFILGIFSFGVLFYLFFKRLYHALIDTSRWSLIVLFLGVFGVLLVMAIFDEWFGWFGYWREYMFEYGFLIVLFTIPFFIYKIRDYAKAPLSLANFNQKKGQLIQLLRSNELFSEETRGQVLKTIILLLDDLSDTFHISDDPKVLKYFAYGKSFEQLKRIFKGCMDKNFPMQRAYADIQNLAWDLENSLEAQVSLRISPILIYHFGGGLKT